MSVFSTILKDLRFAARQLQRTPGFTAVAVLSLALGIGANTAIFSAIEALMLRPLPVRDPQQLVILEWAAKEFPNELVSDIEGGGGRSIGDGRPGGAGARVFSSLAFDYLREHNDVFSSTFGIAGNDLSLNVGLAGRAEPAIAQGVSGNYFGSVGIEAFMGRTIQPEDDRDGAPEVAVLSYAFWQTKLGKRPAVIGENIVANGKSINVIGIAPRDFNGLDPARTPDLWIPLHQFSADEAELGNSNNGVPFIRDPQSWWVIVAGRLKSGKTVEEAQSQLNVLFQQNLKEAVPNVSANELPALYAFSLSRGISDLRTRFSSSLFMLMAVVGLVLLIACGNIASLLIARGSSRLREIAVRLSLGANRARLMQQLLTESVLLAIAGGLAGLLFAVWADSVLISLLSGGRSPLRVELALNLPVLIFTMALSIMSGIVFGLAPAIYVTRADALADLKQGARSQSSMFLTGKVLIGAQVALCLMVITGAGLFVRTLQKLQGIDVGFANDHLLLFTVRPGLNKYSEENLSRYYEDLQARIRNLKGVSAVSFATRSPIGAGTGRSGGTIVGVTPADQVVEFYRHQIGPDYFKTLGVPVIMGRAITAQDGKNAEPVVVINQKLATMYFRDANPLGNVIRFGSRQKPIDYRIVGVVKDVRYSQIRDDAPATLYFSYLQFLSVSNFMTFEVRTEIDPLTIAESVRREALALDRNVPVVDMKSQSRVINQVVYLERTLAVLTTAFGALALLLACVGLYGTMSYAVMRRTREIGIRMALGARQSDIVWGVVREALIIVVAGLTIGLPLTLVTLRFLRDRLFGLTPQDPATSAAALIVISAVTLLAAYIPARRASAVPPTTALRNE